jgi:hypothetical protein
VLQALESLLSEEHVDFQVAFFCDIETEGDSRDVAKLRDLMVRFRENIAFMPFDPRLEMLMASGADGAIMASFFEPFGYAPIWIAAQGGIVLTAANGGQLDIFSPESTFFLDIKADINKPRPIGWRRRLEHLLISNDEYRRRTFDHNVKAIRCGLLAAKQAYASPERRLALMKANMARISELARSDHFTNGVLTTILTNGFKPREDAASMERAGLDFKSLVLLLAAQRPDIGRFASWIRAYVENGTATVADGKRHSALRRQYSRLSQRIAIVRNEDSVKRLVNGSVHRAATKG